MSRIKADLICEIIRKSQTNYLEKQGWSDPGKPEISEQFVLEWVRNHAKQYREYYVAQLQMYSTTRLGEILKALTESGKDLTDVIHRAPQFADKPNSGPVPR
ncbi:hypothetical protein ACTRW9_06975 [Nitrospina sp. 32_T5]|uniref:hypothetical protein n=1 Tax=unclassified Nitrospina TaxID=2638683 RepID=UPI003F9BF9AF